MLTTSALFVKHVTLFLELTARTSLIIIIIIIIIIIVFIQSKDKNTYPKLQ